MGYGGILSLGLGKKSANILFGCWAVHTNFGLIRLSGYHELKPDFPELNLGFQT
jgi:hypothetical protein